MRPPSSVRVGSELDVFVEGLTGKTSAITVTEKSTVDDMKTIIQDKTGIPHELIRLTFSSKQLEDGQIVKRYGLRQD